MLNIKTLSVTGIATLALFVFAIAPAWKDSPNNMAAPLASYIVQAASLELAVQAVQDVGGEITHELGIQFGRGPPDGRTTSRPGC